MTYSIIQHNDCKTGREIPIGTLHYSVAVQNRTLPRRYYITNALTNNNSSSSSSSSSSLHGRANVIPVQLPPIEEGWMALAPENSASAEGKRLLQGQMQAFNDQHAWFDTTDMGTFASFPVAIYQYPCREIAITLPSFQALLENAPKDSLLFHSLRELNLLEPRGEEQKHDTIYTLNGLEKFRNLAALDIYSYKIGKFEFDNEEMPLLTRLELDDVAYTTLVPNPELRETLAREGIVLSAYVENSDITFFSHQVINIDAFFDHVVFPHRLINNLLGDIKSANQD